MTFPFRRLARLRISNAWLFDAGPGSAWLIDTGHRLERRTLLAELKRCGRSPRQLQGVLLTHRHSDHAGNARYLQRTYGLRVSAHRADAEILAGRQPRPVLARRGGAWVAGLFGKLENHWPAEGLQVDRVLEDGDAAGPFEVHWVGGHTPGSVFFRHAPTAALITGDMLLNAHPPLTIRAGLALPYPSFTYDSGQARRALAAFHHSGVPYEVLLPGHGRAIRTGARRRVGALLTEAGVLSAPPS